MKVATGCGDGKARRGTEWLVGARADGHAERARVGMQGARGLKRIEGRWLGRTLAHRPLTKSGLDVGPLRVGSAYHLAGEPGIRSIVLSLPGLPPWRGAPPGFEVRPSSDRSLVWARPGLSWVPPEVLVRWPVSPLEARVSPEFRAAMSVGKDTLSQNRTAGKRSHAAGCARGGDERWISAPIEGRDRRNLSQYRRLGCPQKWGGQVASVAFISSIRSQSASAVSSLARAVSRSAESVSKRARFEV